MSDPKKGTGKKPKGSGGTAKDLNEYQKDVKKEAVIFMHLDEERNWFSCWTARKPANRLIHFSILKISRLFVRAWWQRRASLSNENTTLFRSLPYVSRTLPTFVGPRPAPGPILDHFLIQKDRHLIPFRHKKNVDSLCTSSFHVLKLANTTQKGVPCFTSKVRPKVRRDTHTHTRTLKRPQLASSFPVLKVTNATLFDHFLTLKGGGFPLRTHTHTHGSFSLHRK